MSFHISNDPGEERLDFSDPSWIDSMNDVMNCSDKIKIL